MRWPWLILTAAKAADTQGSPAETAPLKSDTHDSGMEWLPVMPNPDVTAKTQEAKLSDYRYAYGVYLEMLHRDPHLQSVLSQRVGAVIAAPRSVQPADESPEAQAVADLVRSVLDSIDGFGGDLREMASSCYLGVSYHEALAGRKRASTWRGQRARCCARSSWRTGASGALCTPLRPSCGC